MSTLASGSAYDQTGAGLKGTYDFGPTFYAGRAQALLLHPFVVGDPTAVGITSVKIELQGSQDGTHFDPIVTMDLQLTNQLLEQAIPDAGSTYSLPTTGVTKTYGPLQAIESRGFAGGMRLGVKVAGTPAAGDRVYINFEATV